MAEKLNIAVLCGGQSAEHEVSILSAKNVVSNLDKEKFTPFIIYLSQEGHWYWVGDVNKSFESQNKNALVLLPGNPKAPFALERDPKTRLSIDCVIPMLHGTCGEDGTVQGLLEVLRVPYVGSDVLSSSLCMQKHIAKRLLRFAGLPTPDWIRMDSSQTPVSYTDLSNQFGHVFFVKPSALGSSVGISKVHNEKEYNIALHDAFRYDNEIIVERCIDGREIECSVLGNDDPVASLPGELITQHEFYSYEAKYHDPDSLKIITPVKLQDSVVRKIQDLAISAFKVLQCRGMARVDFFLTSKQEIFINEVNTIPGFTDLSMYPKNWEVSGLSFSALLDDLIQLALSRYRSEHDLSHFYLGPPNVTNELTPQGKELE